MTRKSSQGREITATIQAPDEEQLEMMLRELGDYTAQVGLEPIEILKRGPDPDGGYKAVIIAHNFNPIRWLKEKYEERGFTPEEKASLKAIKKQVKYQKVRAKRVAGGAAEVRAEAAKAARAEYARRGEVPKKYKVEAEIPVYGVRALRAAPVPVFETTPKAKRVRPPKEAVYELTARGMVQQETTPDEFLSAINVGFSSAAQLVHQFQKSPEAVYKRLKSLMDEGLIQIRTSTKAEREVSEILGERLSL